MVFTDRDERRFMEKDVIARETKYTGWGLFAKTQYAPGDTILWLNYEEDTRTCIVRWEESYGACIDRGFTLVPGFAFCCTAEHPFWHLNHSCNANSGVVNWGRMESRGLPIAAYRRIAPGEQITISYWGITTTYDGSVERDPFRMDPCLCEEPTCQGAITGFEALPIDIQNAWLMPGEGPQGRIIAHILRDTPSAVERLRQYPRAYQNYLEALEQQDAISRVFESRPIGTDDSCA
jgi:hypothetical protein